MYLIIYTSSNKRKEKRTGMMRVDGMNTLLYPANLIDSPIVNQSEKDNQCQTIELKKTIISVYKVLSKLLTH